MTRQSQRHRLAFRRGVAMLLVIICMVVATILTTAYLASRDNSAIIGENVAHSSVARWAAESGLDFGVTTLQTTYNWRMNHLGGKLVDDLPFQNALIDIDLIDMETDAPPTTNTEYVQVRSTATVNGVEHESRMILYVPPDFGKAVEVDLAEFAVFAVSGLTLQDRAILTRWPMAPLSRISRRVAVGTTATDMSKINVVNTAKAVDTSVYHDDSASASLVNDSTATVQEVALLDPIPVPRAPEPGVSDPETGILDLITTALDYVGANFLISSSDRVESLRMRGGTMTFQHGVTYVVEDFIRLEQNAKFIINGDVRIVVFQDLTMTDSAIEVKPGGRLSIFVADDVTLDDSYIGDERSHTLRDNTGTAEYFDPWRVQIFGLDRANAMDWLLKDNSVAKATIYAPTANATIQDDSSLYGRMVIYSGLMKHDGALFYDTALDQGTGYTNPKSNIYNGDGTIKDAYAALLSLDDADLMSLATAESLRVKAKGRNYGLVAISPSLVGPTDPTPRPIDVEILSYSSGSNVTTWEKR